MKHILLVLSLSLVPLLSSSQSDKVYICTGQYATTYHRTPKCSGLGNCKAEIKAVTLSEAKSKNRRPCQRCY